MLKDLIKQNSATESVADECFSRMDTELQKMTCLEILEHYTKICRILFSKRTIPEPTMRRIKFIADKEYANTKGDIYDIAFALDLVRYNVAEIINVLPITEQQFMEREEQYERLISIEKTHHMQEDSYPLGSWDNKVFCEAEKILKGKRFVDGAALQCALYLLINAIQNERAEKLSIDICFRGEQVRNKYRSLLNEMFIADKYCVYHFGGNRNLNQDSKNKLCFKLLETKYGRLRMPNNSISDIPQGLFDTAQAELKKITCYDIPKPQFEDPRTLRWHADVGIVTDTFRYVLMDGKYYEQCDTYERGISYHYIGDTADDMVAHLIFEAVWQYAIHNTVTNNEAELVADKCFSLLDEKYRPYYIRRKTALQKLKEKGII